MKGIVKPPDRLHDSQHTVRKFVVSRNVAHNFPVPIARQDKWAKVQECYIS